MFACEVCQKEFETEKGLRGHMMSHKKAEKQEKAKETKTKNETTTAQPMTTEERAIADLVGDQDTDWFTIREDELNDFSLAANPFDLPPEAEKMQNEKVYAFRFCERKPERVRQLTRGAKPPKRWAIVNKNNLPELGHLVDTITGGVIVEDQIMLFKPWSHHAAVQEAKQRLADASYMAGTLKGKRRQMENAVEGVEAYEGEQYKISSRDEVMADESVYDGLGDLVVDE